MPQESTFEPIDGHRLSQDPLGLLPDNDVRLLEMQFHDLTTSFSQLPPSQISVSSAQSSRMKDYKTRIRFLINRLRTPMLWAEAIQCWVFAQRCNLELKALQTWVTSVGPIWDSQPAFAVHALRDVVGALTEQPVVAQKLYQAGIPVWFFRKLRHLDNSLLVGRWSTETDPIPIRALPAQYTFDDASPPHPTVYSGLLNDLSRYKAMARYNWSQAFPSTIWGPDPAIADVSFNHAESSAVARQTAPAPSSSSGTSSSSPSTSSVPVVNASSLPLRNSSRSKLSSSRPVPYTKSKKVEPRNKFVDPISPLLPKAIDPWAEASQLVGRDFDHTQPARQGVLRGYVLPEPALFVTQKDDTMQEYLRMYLKLRAALMYRISKFGAVGS
ncbi:hypothetical protein BT96DRAFT_952183, partial [Gymnopus androsaceus JB14]